MVPNALASVFKSTTFITAAGGCTAALLCGRLSSTLVVTPDTLQGAEIIAPGTNRSYSWQPLSSGYFAQPNLCGLHREQSVPQQCSLGVVHSTEALSAVDGPGLRYVVHLGSPIARPAALEQGKPFSPASVILQDLQLHLASLTPNDGGLTVSGVDPLLQPTFCEELFKGAHDLDVTTCLHTPPPEDPPEVHTSVLAHADSVIVQLSSNVPRLCSAQDGLAAFTGFLEELGVPYHIRYLLVPEVTDRPADVGSLVDFARSRGSQLQGIQVMPLHLLGGRKWEALGLPSSLRSYKPSRLQDALQMVQHMKHQGVAAALAV